MSLKSMLGLAACVLMAFSVGCSSSNGTFRAQNPAYGPMQEVHYGPAGCDDCGKGWYPTHRHTYDYKAPQGLVYPPANQPAAVIQYPYYTLKGPDDFFFGQLEK
ncbi:MAG: hypothetical protein Tsb009_29040 [Planctomycetaceae bacterium]